MILVAQGIEIGNKKYLKFFFVFFCFVLKSEQGISRLLKLSIPFVSLELKIEKMDANDISSFSIDNDAMELGYAENDALKEEEDKDVRLAKSNTD